jgi:hypothetical protein
VGVDAALGSGVPQASQKRAWGRWLLPQAGQRASTAAPQRSQKWAPGRRSWPQAGQVTADRGGSVVPHRCARRRGEDRVEDGEGGEADHLLNVLLRQALSLHLAEVLGLKLSGIGREL